MKKHTYSLFLFFWLIGFTAFSQTAPPTVPERIPFGNMSVQLDPDARRIVQQDVNALLNNQQYWVAKLDRVVLYFPLIESILIQEGVPTDFKYLAVQESSLTPDAVSTSNAVGYWQFKKETAALNGLRVDEEIDERKSIAASTRGAATYLKKSNTQFNNWVASLYSYYLGATGITKLIPPDWAYAREVALDGRTDRYILRFFAHKVAIENALKTHQTNNRFALVEYNNGGGKTMRSIAEELGVDEFELRKYNRWVLGEAVPTDRAYVLAIPVASTQINDVRQKMGTVAASSASKAPEIAQGDVGFPVLRRVSSAGGGRNAPVLYEINGLPGIQAQTGDNATTLARKAKISYSSFLRFNDMDESNPVIVNDIYYLAKKRKKALVPFHTVREGETSHSISQRYGLRLRKLLRYNRLDNGQQLTAGRVMWLRERRPASTPVEIINAPTPPVYDPTPAPPSTRPEVAANTPTERSGATGSRAVSGSENVPRNSSERRLYQPKLAGGGVTPNDGTSAPATAPATPPATTNTVSPSRPAPSTTNNTDGSQRVVIVRSTDTDGTSKTVPVATTPEVANTSKNTSVEDGWSPSGTKSVREATAASRTKPIKPTETSNSTNPGPSEQQADGSIVALDSKPSSRPSTPTVVKTERTTETVVTTMAEKADKKVPTSVVTTTEKKSVTVSSPTTSAVTTHVVEKGETYYGIARKYGLTLNELLDLNNRTVDSKLAAGQKLKVKTNGGEVVKSASKPEPTVAKTTTTTQKVTETRTTSSATYHTVAKGENLFRISKLYGVSVSELQEWNNLSTAYVQEGQKIRVVKP